MNCIGRERPIAEAAPVEGWIGLGAGRSGDGSRLKKKKPRRERGKKCRLSPLSGVDTPG
jgi:hypothetical protein